MQRHFISVGQAYAEYEVELPDLIVIFVYLQSIYNYI